MAITHDNDSKRRGRRHQKSEAWGIAANKKKPKDIDGESPKPPGSPFFFLGRHQFDRFLGW